LAYAAFAATSVIFESHSPQEISAYRRFMIDRANSAAEDVSSDVNVNLFVQQFITAVKTGAVPEWCFRIDRKLVDHPPDRPNQGSWTEYDIYFDPRIVHSYLQKDLHKAGDRPPLGLKDLKDQLSKMDCWIKPKEGTTQINKRMGQKGEMKTAPVWGLKADKHPLGYQPVSDEQYKEYQSEQVDENGSPLNNGDPRKGDFFALIEKVLKFREDEEKE
jgi:hypothetical protein